MKRPSPRQRGAALFLTLAFLVLICIIIVGFALSMRMDRPSASSHLDRAMALQYSQMGVETVTATLRAYTADPRRYWISQPGQLWVGAAADVSGTPGDERLVLQPAAVPLSSGVPSGSITKDDLRFPDLNITTLRDPSTHLLTDRADPDNPGATVSMKVRWIYVRQDGSLDNSEQPLTTNATNPIVGRYAFWADDESSKINYNIAWGRAAANTRPSADPTRISLDVLTSFTPARSAVMRQFITSDLNYETLNKGFFNTPTDARRVEQESGGAGIAAALQENKFEVTHYNHDPDTTFFNEPRIVLTTRPDRAGWTYNSSTGKWEGGRPYIQVLKNEGVTTQPDYIPQYTARPSTPGATSPTFIPDPLDPGFVSNIDPDKVSNTLYFLMSYLQRADWPMVNGSGSFQSKYYADYGAAQASSRLAQLAINIIDYVRSKESPAEFVDPLRAYRSAPANAPAFTIHSTFLPIPGSAGKFSPFTASSVPPKFSVSNNATTSESFIGLTRAPSITEMAFWLAEDRRSHISAFEIYLPRNYGVDAIDLNTMYIGAQHRPGSGDAITSIEDQLDPNALTNGNDPAKHHIRLLDGPLSSNYTSTTSVTQLRKGQYVTVLRYKERPSGFNSRPNFRLRGFLGSWGSPVGGGRWYCDMAPPLDINVDGSAHSSLIFYNTDAANGSVPPGAEASTVNLANLTSVEVDDPRVNKSNGNWTQNNSGTRNSFGVANSNSSLRTPASPIINPTNRPGQDVGPNGKIDPDSSLYMPPPAGRTFVISSGVTDDNSRGMVSSIGELGYVHTGVEASPWQSGQPTGVPWRTFRLQPSKQGSDVVPDWALMDLFTVPSTVDDNARQLFTPHDTAYGGRVNVNSKVEPFLMNRTLPLQAVLSGAFTGSGTARIDAGAAAALADNIYNRVPASDGKLFPSASYYISHGQIAEIKGIADGGEASEAVVREIGNLLTSRGNVFSVYSVGQTIKQTPGGTLQVTAEQRQQAIIERYQDPLTSEINFAPVYWRRLVP